MNAPTSLPMFNLGSLNYILAHEALESKAYFDNNHPSRRRKVYTILDNGADELGTGLSGPLMGLVDRLEPDELILPDVLGETEATIDATEKFLADNLIPPGLSAMAVVQGKNRQEWDECFQRWNRDDRVAVIGVPYDIPFDPFDSYMTQELAEDMGKHKSQWWGENRYNMMSIIISQRWAKKPIHLLGMNNLAELRRYGSMTYDSWAAGIIRSNDTTAPFAAANVGRWWANGDSGHKDWKSLNFAEGRLSVDCLLNNLIAYFSACQDLTALKELVDGIALAKLPRRGQVVYKDESYSVIGKA